MYGAFVAMVGMVMLAAIPQKLARLDRATKAHLWQESRGCGSAWRSVLFLLNDFEFYKRFGLSANCEKEVSHLAPLCKGSCRSAVQHFRYSYMYQVKNVLI